MNTIAVAPPARPNRLVLGLASLLLLVILGPWARAQENHLDMDVPVDAPVGEPTSGTSPEIGPGTTVETTLEGEGYVLPATVEVPTSPSGRCVVFFAGSGPTDRNWNNPLVPQGIGSAQLLGEALRERGIGSIRFDKVGSGHNFEHLEVVTSIDHYVDEGALAFEHLVGQYGCTAIFFVGSSEGALHSLRLGVRFQADARFGGVVTLSGPGKQVLEIVMDQVSGQINRAGGLLSEEQVAYIMSDFFTAFRALPDAETPGTAALIPILAQTWQQAVDPTIGPLIRELLLADPTEAAAAYEGPLLIMSASHDVQIPVEHGALLLEATPDAGQLVRREVVEQANHVFRAETRTFGEASELELSEAYADPDVPLAPGVVDILMTFIDDVTAE